MDVFTWCQSCYWISWIFSERECVYTCYIHEKSESTYDIIFKAAVLQSQRQQTGYLYANLRLPIRLLCLLNIFFFSSKKVSSSYDSCQMFRLSFITESGQDESPYGERHQDFWKPFISLKRIKKRLPPPDASQKVRSNAFQLQRSLHVSKESIAEVWVLRNNLSFWCMCFFVFFFR